MGVSTKEPSHAGKVVQLARQRGLLILTAGSDTIRILPSLTVTREQVDKAVDIIESCLLVVRDEVQRSSSASASASASSSSAGAQQQVRAFSSSARSSAAVASTGNASADQIQSLYKDFIALGQSWPKDPLRPRSTLAPPSSPPLKRRCSRSHRRQHSIRNRSTPSTRRSAAVSAAGDEVTDHRRARLR